MKHEKSILTDFGKALHHQASRSRIRFCVIISGDMEWGSQVANIVSSSYVPDSIIRISDQLDDFNESNDGRVVVSDKSRSLLGQEFESVIYHCPSTLNPNALGIAGGTIKAGGLLILVIPKLSQWAKVAGLNSEEMSPIPTTGKANNYTRRLVRIITNSTDCFLIEHGKPIPKLPNWFNTSEHPSTPVAPDYTDQERAINAVKKVMSGQRRRPVVLLSDRGRGKSAALGLAAKQLIKIGVKKIGVTGFNRDSVGNVFKHAEISSQNNPSSLQYFSAQELLRERVDIELLLVDEAATIPLTSLIKILKCYPRIAFASTVHPKKISQRVPSGKYSPGIFV